MSKTQSHDVLIVGLGPAGCRAAAEAAVRGLKVLGIDRRGRPGEPVQCAEFVPALLGQELDMPIAVRRQRITEMATFVEDQSAECRDDCVESGVNSTTKYMKPRPKSTVQRESTRFETLSVAIPSFWFSVAYLSAFLIVSAFPSF